MGKFKIYRDVENMKGLCVIEPEVVRIGREEWMETYNLEEFNEAGLDYHFVQDNEVHNKKGVLRGMHVNKSHPQGKMIRVLSGKIFDVVVDLRKGSRTYEKWCGVILSAENKRQLYIPEGMGHGYLTLTEADVLFKVTTHFIEGEEIGFAWNSRKLGIQWTEIGQEYIMSCNDRENRDLSLLEAHLR